jgi:hypothetical protein
VPSFRQLFQSMEGRSSFGVKFGVSAATRPENLNKCRVSPQTHLQLAPFILTSIPTTFLSKRASKGSPETENVRKFSPRPRLSFCVWNTFKRPNRHTLRPCHLKLKCVFEVAFNISTDTIQYHESAERSFHSWQKCRVHGDDNKSNDNFGNCQAGSRIAAVKNKAINIGAKTGAIVQREACCRNKPDKHKQIVIL